MVEFTEKELRGSRLRCMMLTALSPAKVAESLTAMTKGKAHVGPSDKWQPKGFLDSAEIQLGLSDAFLSADERSNLMDWWLIRKRGARVPTWDVVSTCLIHDRPGLLLVEAKAHVGEFDCDGKDLDGNAENHERIQRAMREANEGLSQCVPGWRLTEASHYQLCNRFAWCWKLASIGIPVALVYLGFIDAADMDDGRRLLRDSAHWRQEVMTYSDGYVPRDGWDTELSIAGTPVISAISSIDFVGVTP